MNLNEDQEKHDDDKDMTFVLGILVGLGLAYLFTMMNDGHQKSLLQEQSSLSLSTELQPMDYFSTGMTPLGELFTGG